MKFLSAFAALLALALPAFAVPVTVVIVGPDKKPGADAHLDVFDSASEKERAASREIAGSGGRFSFNWNGKFAAPSASAEAVASLENLVLVRAGAPGLATKITFVDKNAAVIELGARRAWGGVVLDQNQKPIAGARLTSSVVFVPAWDVETTTDAQGRWQLDDLPAQGTLSLKVGAPNYIGADYSLDLANASAPPLFLKAGATIRGQIVAPDGQPIENAPVIAGYDYGNVVRTDKNGRFELSGIAAGEISLSSADPFNRDPEAKLVDAGYVVPDFEGVVGKAGQTTDIGQWKAEKGVVATARIVDDATGKPMRDTFLNISGLNTASARADEQGVARARFVPDKNPFGNDLGNANAPGHITATIPRRQIKADATAIDLGIVRLERGTVVAGKVRVQGETPQNNADLPMLSLQGEGGMKFVWLWGQSDAFQTEALKPGTYKLGVYLSGARVEGKWKLISPATLTVPAPDDPAKRAPVEVVVKRLNASAAPATPAAPAASAAPQTLREARGQVLDENGQGIGGAVVKVRFKAGQSYADAAAVSGNDGKWSLKPTFTATDIAVQSVERPGYLSVGAATFDNSNGVALVSGLSMKRSGGVFAGRVVNADGAGAAGAWVGIAEIENYPLAQADASGAFQLIDVPLDKFTLLAANADGFARQGSRSDARNLEIKLAPNAPYDREVLVKDAMTGDFEWWRIADLWDYLGSERMGELARRGGANGDWSRYRYALELAGRAPKNFGARRDELTRDLDDEQQAEIEAAWNWARAQAPDEAEKFALNAWVDAQKAAKRAIDAANVTQLLRVAAVAHRLGRDDVGDLSDYAAAIAAQLKVDGSTAQEWSEPLAKSGYAAALSFAEGLKPIPEFKLWWRAAGKIAEAGEIEGAQQALARMENLATTPDWIELAARESWNNPTYQIEQVRAQIAGALAETDAAGAQKLAESVEESSRREVVLVIAERAIKAGQPAVAEAALRLAMRSTIGNPENYALAASLAQEVSPQLGEELWAEALERAVPTEKREVARGKFWPSVSMWAFYRAQLDKGQSRVLLEREWNWRLPAAVRAGADEDVDENDVASINALVIAMGVVDPARAGQMRAQAAQKVKSLAGQANVGLAAALLSSDAQRAHFGLNSQLF